MNREEVVRILEKGYLLGSGQDPRLIETHISWVLLSGDYALKIKKPVRFSFLDFSTLELRKQQIEDELHLNRRLAPDVYLAVLPVRQIPDGSLRIAAEGEGEVVEYALQMKRLDTDRQMNGLLKQGKVTFEHMEQLAATLAAFHQEAEKVRLPRLVEDLYERYADLKSNLPEIETLLGESIAGRIKESIAFAARFLDTHRDRLLERQQAGWVVDGHGDLHSGNIFLLR
jgi:hypothetical protein